MSKVEATNIEPHILVTGATGFLGCAILRALDAASVKVRATDRGKDAQGLCAEYVAADILARESLGSLADRAGTVIHAAGLAHIFDRRGAMDNAFWKVNADGTENVARAAAAAGAKHFVLVSSASVYGPHNGTVDEECPCHPAGAYAESKLEAERRAGQIARESGMALTILRPVTMYGEGDPGNVLRLMRAVDRRRFLWIGDGHNRKSLLHRDDVAEACVMALSHRPGGESVFNVAGCAFEMREIIATMARELGRKLPPFHLPAGLLCAGARLLGRISPSIAGGRNGLADSLRKWTQDDVYDGSRLQQALGWQPSISLSEGLRREAKWYRDIQRGQHR